ncbi:hypothetical protein [Elizabethkingia anophelis]|uniref:hypothetical protein n=1 Tax=Elizabethkingia anophelis TaxID=1117645 RepID=UPI0016240961|nr:hypothetical protein [Elizabethkingia anophelis]
MKKVIVVVTYEAYIPEDMMVDQLSQNIEEVVRDRFDDFRATAENYDNKEESEPLFEISDVMVGTESMIAIGGN